MGRANSVRCGPTTLMELRSWRLVIHRDKELAFDGSGFCGCKLRLGVQSEHE